MNPKSHHIIRAFLIILAVAIFVPAIAQNTKGDRAVSNRGKVRETKGKTIKKKNRVTTKDIAGRRLRTKNKSSASRANVGIPQPITTRRQPRRKTDHAARVPSNKSEVVSKFRRKSDPDRQWQGDVSGYKPRRIKPASAEESGRNVYSQNKYVRRHPKPSSRPFKGYEGRTASGKVIVKRKPKHSERAWKGDIQGQPFYPPPTETGRLSNLFDQKTKYSRYVTKSPSTRDRAFGNRGAVAKAKRLGTDTRPKDWKRAPLVSPTGQAPYVTHGKKNVYWGKFKVGGKAKTRDLAGRPLQKRNFRSTGIGVGSRDSLAFFGRRPHGDLAGQKRKGNFIPGSEARGGWLNDIAGHRLRKNRSAVPGVKGFGGFNSTSGRFRTNGKIQGKAPGIGAGAIERDLKRTNGGNGRNFGDQGGAFTGFIKQRRPGNYHGKKRPALWNNNGTAVEGKLLPGNAGLAGRFSGRLRREKLYPDQAENYRGFIKGGKKAGKFIGSYGHKFWNNNGTAVEGKLLPGNAGLAGRFSGRIRGGPDKNFSDQGSGYTGDLKRGRSQGKFVGSLHKFWNNKGKSVTDLQVTREGALAGSYRGHTKPQAKGKAILVPHRLWNNKGKAVTDPDITSVGALAGNYHGHIKQKERGKAILIPNKHWNNNGKATTDPQVTKWGALAGGYQGRLKAKQPVKYPIANSNKMWNNSGKATTQINLTGSGAQAGNYQGHTKAKKHEKYPIANSNKMWNNNGKATTQIRLTAGGAAAGKFQGHTKYKKENKDRNSDIEKRIKLKEQYTQNPHSVEEAIKKQKPELNYKAGNFASGAKVVGKRRHNPHSVDDALDAYHNQASARRVDYQGNVKMRKFIDRRESPDAKFVHMGENNVKEERTLFTNMKLLWAKLFQKSDSQPSNLKDRSNKLRYDKGEKGLWAD